MGARGVQSSSGVGISRRGVWLVGGRGRTCGYAVRWRLKSCRPMSKSDLTAAVVMTYVLSRYRKMERMVSIWAQ